MKSHIVHALNILYRYWKWGNYYTGFKIENDPKNWTKIRTENRTIKMNRKADCLNKPLRERKPNRNW